MSMILSTKSLFHCLIVLLANGAGAFVHQPFGFSGVTTVHDWSQSSSQLGMATWSDSKAVKDYQDFLASGKQEVELARDCASVIIRPFENSGDIDLAVALHTMGNGDDLVLTPDMPVPDMLGENREYPIYVTLPPTQLDSFLANLPESHRERPEDFVFFSGGLKYGNIEDLLKSRGYCRDSMTQVIPTGFKAASGNRYEDISVKLGSDAYGEVKLAGECVACGKWAGAIAERLERNTIRCRTDFYREWRRKMWERNIYDAVFHLVGAVRAEPTTMKDVALYYEKEVSEMLWDISPLLRGWKALTLTYGFEERLFGIGEVDAEQPCTLSEEMYPFIWGNRVFQESRQFVDYLVYAQSERGLIPGIELPQKSEEDYVSNMMKGNMRADGVV